MDHYQTLGIGKSAVAQEIRKAYLRLAKHHHPDKNNGNPGSENSFKEIQHAYSILSRPDRKRKYDIQIGNTILGKHKLSRAYNPYQRHGQQAGWNATKYTKRQESGGYEIKEMIISLLVALFLVYLLAVYAKEESVPKLRQEFPYTHTQEMEK